MKQVVVLPERASDDRSIFNQGLYLDRKTWSLVPNLVVMNERGDFLFETNSLRLRGPEPDPGQRIAVIWGDSVVFSMVGSGWPEQINDPSIDVLFLNGGVEGSDYAMTLRRALELNRSKAVALNVIMAGWTPVYENQRLIADLENAVEEIPNAVLVTQPTSLNPRLAITDLNSFFADDLAFGPWRFWGDTPYSVGTQVRLYFFIMERNAIIAEVARKTKTPLIDLYRAFDTMIVDDFRRHFFDISHFRRSAYPTVASIVRESVRPLLRQDYART